MAPGSFTHLLDTGEWVWTTFHEFQWDLELVEPRGLPGDARGAPHARPTTGVDVVRLDAAPFLWKRLGTDCQNQPEAHRILQALRAVTRLAMPGLAAQGRGDRRARPARALPRRPRALPARVRPGLRQPAHGDALVGARRRDVRLPAHALSRRPRVPEADRVGHLRALPRRHRLGGLRRGRLGGRAHPLRAPAVPGRLLRRPAPRVVRTRRRLPGTTRRPATPAPPAPPPRCRARGGAGVGRPPSGRRRAHAARDDVRRGLLVRQASRWSTWATRSRCSTTRDWADDPDHAEDNRWLHRPAMDWEAAARRRDPTTAEGRMFHALQRLASARAEHGGVALRRRGRASCTTRTRGCSPTSGHTRGPHRCSALPASATTRRRSTERCSTTPGSRRRCTCTRRRGS